MTRRHLEMLQLLAERVDALFAQIYAQTCDVGYHDRRLN